MNKPFLLKPVGKDYLWGGNRLNEDFHKNIDMSPLAESWECSIHPDGPSTVASGEFAGKLFPEVLEEHPEYMGRRLEFPILVKLIDAKQSLSVQVHPSDEYAIKNENGQLGKTEMWVVLDATEDATLVYGLKNKVKSDDFLQKIIAGKLEDVLYTVPVKKGDVFFIESGTIHAIGAGCLIAEIQENSNLTYRVYDYNRVGKDGKKRDLHIHQAMQVAKLDRSPKVEFQKPVTFTSEDYNEADLAKCSYFDVKRVDLFKHKMISTSRSEFKVLLFTEGSAHLSFIDGELDVNKGDCVFVPAQSVSILVQGNAQFLEILC